MTSRRLVALSWRQSLAHATSRKHNLFGRSSARLFSTGSAAEEELEPREAMEYDVVVVGGGPAGLSTAIRLKQLQGDDISVCVVEKGAEVGSHIISGNVFDPCALNQLLPDWKERDAPLGQPVTKDRFRFLVNSEHALPCPVPPSMQNEGNYIISLSALTRWLGEQAEEVGVDIFPGFAASEVLRSDDDERRVTGIATGDVGIQKDGTPGPNFARGMELHSRQLVLAEGCRGSCSEEIIEAFNLRDGKDPQHYAIGLKEVWEIDESLHEPGLVEHGLGWPLDPKTYAGHFMYHANDNQVHLGVVIGLDYQNPHLNPYEEFQRFKHHPSIAKYLKGGECVQYGARALNEGGFQSLPKLTFPGGLLTGCSAGFLNIAKIKGTHYAMQSGIEAAEAIVGALESEQTEATDYSRRIEESFIHTDLHKSRNMAKAFAKFGRYGGMIFGALSEYVLKGRESFTWTKPETDSECTLPAKDQPKIDYPKPDGKISFDILTNLQRSGVYHEEDQPAHLRIKPGFDPAKVSLAEFDGPETRFCPAKVYEYVESPESGELELVINAQNCIHCKTCSIKMPYEYIQWTVPEGTGGPNYECT